MAVVQSTISTNTRSTLISLSIPKEESKQPVKLRSVPNHSEELLQFYALHEMFLSSTYVVSLGPTSRNLYLSFFLSFILYPTFKATPRDVARRRTIAGPIDPWRNSTPDFGAVAFCTTNIDDFRTSLTSTSSTISSTYSSQKRS